MEFQTRGVLPRMKQQVKTPLHSLLNSLTPKEKHDLKYVQLSPKLGYRCTLRFTVPQLLRWLGDGERFGEWEQRPCDSYAIRGFHKKLTLADLTS
jgi:hypothetical protein